MKQQTKTLSLSAQVSNIYQSHRRFFATIGFCLIVGIFALIFYLRFPDNYTYPNFFAEDGQHFAQNVLDHGLLHSLFITFNGYFISGIYLVTGIGFGINKLFAGGHFVNLPASFAVASYLFFGFCAALPIALLRKYMSLPYRLVAALLICLVPMPSFDYGTIGTIGNVKFAFYYIAFLLVLYRIKLARQNRSIILVDLGLLLCAYTTAESYVVLPFILLADGVQLKQILKRSAWRTTFKKDNIALWSLLSLGFLVFLQVAMVAIKGVPALTGYLDEPYQLSKTVEIFVGRTMLYPFVAAGYHHMTDFLSVILLAVWVGLMYRVGDKKNYWVYGLGIFSIAAATAVFVSNRTGVSIHYDHYQSTVFDNFFYAQNFVAVILAIVLLSDMSKRFNWLRRSQLIWLSCALLVVGELYAGIAHPPTNFMPYQIGTIRQQLQVACARTERSPVTFSVYPFSFLTMTESHQRACSAPPTDYAVGLRSFGLTTTAAHAINVSPGNQILSQTFVSPRANLDGLAIYLSTYSQTILRNYEIQLKDARCRTILLSQPLPLRVNDNAYRVVRFADQPNSADKMYCFSVKPTSSSAQPLALQLSSKPADFTGSLIDGSRKLDSDVVFQAIYK